MDHFDVMIIGSCNTDLITYTKEMPRVGQTVHGYKFSIGCGGKGANQCIAAAKMGASTAILAKLGNDQFGKEFIKSFKDVGVNTDCVKTIEGSTGVAQITVSDNGDNQIVIVSGANDTLCAEDLKEAVPWIASSKVVLFQFETPMETTISALKMCQEFKDTKTIVNAAPAVSGLGEDFFDLCDIFCVNEIEAEITTGLLVRNVEEAKIAAYKLRTMGCRIPVITLGSDGVVFIPEKDEKSAIHVPANRVSAVDTTGAGDAFLGSLAYFLSKLPDLSLEEVIKRACEVAAYSVQRRGTSISFATREDLPEELFH